MAGNKGRKPQLAGTLHFPSKSVFLIQHLLNTYHGPHLSLDAWEARGHKEILCNTGGTLINSGGDQQ